MEETRKVANDNASLSRAQIAIENKLDLYYQAVLKKSVYATSTILDPRFKHSYFKGRKDAAAIKETVFEGCGTIFKVLGERSG